MPPPNLTPNNNEQEQETSAYVRQAKPGEIETIANVLTRAFARDPMMNWLGDVRALVPTDHKGDEDEDADVRRTLANLRDFELGVLKMERPGDGGLLQVVVLKEEGGKAAGGEGEGDGDGEGDKERIVGCALWGRPAPKKGSYLSSLFSLSWLVKSWGFCGIKVRSGTGSRPPRAQLLAAALHCSSGRQDQPPPLPPPPQGSSQC